MKAFQTIGFYKSVRFVFYLFYAWLIHLSLPPVKVWLMRLAGARIGSDVVIFDVRFSNLYHYGFRKLAIGHRCFIGDEVMLDLRGGITLEDDVTLSNRATIVSHINVGYPEHPLQKIYPTKETPVVFKNGSYIGTGAIILAGVTVGAQSVVAAGSVVIGDVPRRTVVAGVPAVEKKKLLS